MKIASWNVNGLRAAMRKGLPEKVKELDVDVLFLQNIKMQKDQLTPDMELKELGYQLVIHPAKRKGYSGVGVYTRVKPDKIWQGAGDQFDEEGRVIRVDFGKLSIFGIFFPNGGNGDERLVDKMSFYEHYLQLFKKLKEQGRKVIVTGDFNVAHQAIDLANPGSNQEKPGFLASEREWFTKLLDAGFVDVYRERNPEEVKYTFWDERFKARDRNVGWRIDYVLVDEELLALVEATEIRNDLMGSDHCPVTLTLNWPLEPEKIEREG